MDNLVNLTKQFVEVPQPAEGEDFPMIDESVTKLKLAKIKSQLKSFHEASLNDEAS